jgi:hypothetical protein
MVETQIQELEAAIESYGSCESVDYASSCGCTDNCQNSCSGSCEGGCDSSCYTTAS